MRSTAIPFPVRLCCRHVAVVKFVAGLLIGFVLFSWPTPDYPDCRGQGPAVEDRRPAPPQSLAEPGRNLVLVGVMTAQKYLHSRAVAVYDTWGQRLPGKVLFFSSYGSNVPEGLPVVSLPGVDDSYPPQKKSFMMLKYMHDNYLHEFDWFIRADDDVYIRGDKLETFLRSVDSSKAQFIGQAGLGNKQEFGTLSLSEGDNFCMGGPGMIFSRTTLQTMVPHIGQCIRNLYSTHEDVEVGRCVSKYVGISCTWSYEMQKLFYHNFSDTGINKAFTGNLHENEIYKAITLHPVKQSSYMYTLHNFFLQQKSFELRHKTVQLRRELEDSDATSWADDGYREEALANRMVRQNHSELFHTKPAILHKYRPQATDSILKWTFFSKEIYRDGDVSPRKATDSSFRFAQHDILIQVMDQINGDARSKGRTIDFKEVLYGYYRVNPLYGVEYVFDILLVYRKHKGKRMTVSVRRHAYFQQPFSKLEITEVSDVQMSSNTFQGVPSLYGLPSGDQLLPDDQSRNLVSSKPIHFVLPLSGRGDTFKTFMKTFAEACLATDEIVKLLVVYFTTESSENGLDEIEQTLNYYRNLYSGYDLQVLTTQKIFSRAVGLDLGAAFYAPEALLFFCDVDMYFNAAVLNRIRRNTIQSVQVYYPVVFSQYDPRNVYTDGLTPPEPVIDRETGSFRYFGFGMVSVYNSDYKAVGGLDTSILGWGLEDVDLYTKFVNSNFTVFRAPDIDLVHLFHPVHCDEVLPPTQLAMCKGSKASTYASAKQLARKLGYL